MSHLTREFVKIRFQKRTYIGLAGLFLVPFLIGIAMRLTEGGGHPGSGDGGGEFFLEQIRSNGLYISLGSLFMLSTFLLPMLAAMSGSQTIAGEAENGTLRTALMQPVRRGTLLFAKWCAANLYIGLGLLVLLVGSFLAGGAIFGFKPMVILSGPPIGVGHAIGLIFAAHLFVLVAMAAIVTLALLLSTVTNSGLTAVAGALILVIIMVVLGNLEPLDFLRPYLFTNHFGAWINLFRDPIYWDPIRDALINFAVWIGAMSVLAWLIFRRKDILS